MSERSDEKPFFEQSNGRALTPAEQDAFHAGWQAQADLAAEEKRELVTLLFEARCLIHRGEWPNLASEIDRAIVKHAQGQESDSE